MGYINISTNYTPAPGNPFPPNAKKPQLDLAKNTA